MFKRFLNLSQVNKNIVTLMTGTSIAQALPIAISPILTRLYTPEEFGLFALYVAIASIAAVVVTGRYELAIMLPKENGAAINITSLALCLTCVLSSILFLLIIIFNKNITYLLGSPEISNWLYFIPLSTLLVGIYQSLSYWNNRQGSYKNMALSRVSQGSASATVQLSCGYKALGAAGLIGGHILGQAISTFLLLRIMFHHDKRELKQVSQKNIILQAKKYSHFPKFMIPGQLANVTSSYVPILLLGVLN